MVGAAGEVCFYCMFDIVEVAYSHKTIAIAFAYFESLIRLGDKSKFLEEETRLKSLHNMVNAAGIDKWSFEDFADETYDLLRKYMGLVDAGNLEESLVEDFNNEAIQNYIITHFKVCVIHFSALVKILIGHLEPRCCMDEDTTR